jgi:uncharacterized protein (TIGR02246 family)
MTVSADDRFAIHDLFMEYVWAADTGDLEGYVATFMAAALLVDSDGRSHRGAAAIRAYAHAFLSQPNGRGRIHFFQQMTVKPEGAGLRVFSFWTVAQATASPREIRLRSLGTCDDLCLRVEGRWRFAERRIGRWNDETAPWLLKPPA